MITKADKNQARLKRHRRMRNKVAGTTERPRLNVYRSLKNIYAQLIDDVKGVTLVSASTLDKELSENMGHGVWAVTALTFFALILFVFLKVPEAQPQAGGLAQKIFYFHVPAAYALYVCGAVCFVASALYLANPTDKRDAWAKAWLLLDHSVVASPILM